MASYRGDTYDRYEHSDPRDARISTHRSAYPSHSYSDSRHDQPRNYSEMPIGDSLPYAQPPSRPTDPRVRPSARADPPGHDIDQPLIQRSVPEKSGYDSPLKRNFDPRQEEYRRDQYDKHDQIRAGHGYTDNAGVGQPMADAHYRHRVAEPYYDERGHDRRSHEKSAERREEPREDNSKGSSKLPWFEHELQQLSGSVWMEMNNLVKKSYFLALPEDAQRELWADNLRRVDIREPPQQQRQNAEPPMDPRRDYYPPDPAPNRLPPGGASPNRDDEIEAMRKERAILMAERRKIEDLRKVEESRKREAAEAAQLAAKQKQALAQDGDKEEKVLARLSDAEKDQILAKWDWDHFKNHPNHFLYVKRDEIRQKKRKGKTDLEKWFAEIDEWEKKNENNFEDKLKVAETRAKTKDHYKSIQATFKDMDDDIKLLTDEIIHRARDDIRESDMYFSETSPAKSGMALPPPPASTDSPVRQSLIPNRRSLIPSRKQMMAAVAPLPPKPLPTRTISRSPERPKRSKEKENSDRRHAQPRHDQHDDRDRARYSDIQHKSDRRSERYNGRHKSPDRNIIEYASQESGTDMDLGTPPRPTRDTILTDYDNKNINGTQIQHVIGVVSVEEKAKDQGIENLSQTERRNLAKTKAAHVKAKLSNMDNFTEHINEQGERVMMYKPPHERSSAVAAAFTDEPEVTEVVPQPTANTPLDTLTSIRVSIHDKPPNSASRSRSKEKSRERKKSSNRSDTKRRRKSPRRRRRSSSHKNTSPSRSRSRTRSPRRRRRRSRSSSRSRRRRSPGSPSSNRRRRRSRSTSRTRRKRSPGSPRGARRRSPSRSPENESRSRSPVEGSHRSRVRLQRVSSPITPRYNTTITTPLRDESSPMRVQISPDVAIVKQENAPTIPAGVNATIDLTGNSTNVVGTSHLTDIQLFSRPNRFARAEFLCIILRGLPGSGKTVIADNIERIEKKYSKNIRIFTFDEYFVTLDTQHFTGLDKEYDFNDDKEPRYREHMFKEFERCVKAEQTSVVIIDAVNARISDFDMFYNLTAYMDRWTSYVIDIGTRSPDVVQTYFLRQNLKRSMDEITGLSNEWEPTPAHMNTCKPSFIYKPDLNVGTTAKDKVPIPESVRQKLQFQIGKKTNNTSRPLIQQSPTTPPKNILNVSSATMHSIPTFNSTTATSSPSSSLVTMSSFTQRSEKKYKNQQNMYY